MIAYKWMFQTGSRLYSLDCPTLEYTLGQMTKPDKYWFCINKSDARKWRNKSNVKVWLAYQKRFFKAAHKVRIKNISLVLVKCECFGLSNYNDAYNIEYVCAFFTPLEIVQIS